MTDEPKFRVRLSQPGVAVSDFLINDRNFYTSSQNTGITNC